MPDLRLLLRMGVIAATSRSTRVFYDRISAFYELVFTDHLQHARTMAATLSQEFPRSAGTKILDVACGTGVLSRRLEEQGFSMIGLDFSLKSLRRLKQAAGAIPLVQADAACLPFGSACFDVVTCLGAWRHFPDPQRVLHEICRVLRPGGVFLVGYFPPKLGGLFTFPMNWLGNAIVILYGHAIRLLKYNDRIDGEMERRTLEMVKLAFARVRRIDSGIDHYLILAGSPHSQVPSAHPHA
jgi:ubiquinone/menaquinone biosynthesis C-methylase UbiE